MSDLIAPVVDGKVQNKVTSTEKEVKRGTSELGKDAFLQLLVCQMQNQDPLNPSTDTEYVAQLATFSQLEQLQNLTSTTENTQAFSLVGKSVTVKTTDSNDDVRYVDGIVDYVVMNGSKAKISINGNLYDYDELYSVLDTGYVVEHSIPSISKNYKFEYNAQAPDNYVFEVDYGKNDYAANNVSLVVNNTLIDPSYISYDENKVMVSGEAFAELPNGNYQVSVVFNNSLFSTVGDKITLNVFNSGITAPEKAEGGNDEQGN